MNTKPLIETLLPILYEDDHLLAIAKPAGVDVGATGQSTVGLVDILAEIRGHGETLRPANRLSRYESGVLLLGKESTIVERIRGAFRSARVSQEYVAVVLGRMAKPRLVIAAEGGTSQRRRSRQEATAKRRSGPRKSESQTILSLIRQGERRALVRIRTAVKNTHALRAQLRSVRLRLVGDSLRDKSLRTKRPEATCLHLSRVSFHHPGFKSKLTLSSRPSEAFNVLLEGGPDVLRALHAALVRRLPCIVGRETDAYRLLTGSVEGVRGLVAERYGEVVILQITEEQSALREALKPIARWYRSTLGIQAVYTKRFVRDRTHTSDDITDELNSPRPFLGRPVPEQIAIRERGLKFAIRPNDGYSVGLFLDHRDNRRRVRAMAGGKDVLNLFAYTCGFSVAAAAGGAERTVSIDISPKYLDWGRANFQLNGLDVAKHRFVCSPAFDYLRRAERQGELFDLILLDPPSFAHGRKRKHDFSVTRDLADLITAATNALRPAGVLMVSTSLRRMSVRDLRDRLKQGAGLRKLKILETPPLPSDFAMDPDHAKTIFARFA